MICLKEKCIAVNDNKMIVGVTNRYKLKKNTRHSFGTIGRFKNMSSF